MGLFTIFSLPSGYFASTTEFILNITNDLNDLIVMGFGLAVAFWFIPKVIDLIKHSIN